MQYVRRQIRVSTCSGGHFEISTPSLCFAEAFPATREKGRDCRAFTAEEDLHARRPREIEFIFELSTGRRTACVATHVKDVNAIMSRLVQVQARQGAIDGDLWITRRN